MKENELIKNCEFSTKLKNVLMKNKINTLDCLLSLDLMELLEIRGFGRKKVIEIKQFIDKNNLKCEGFWNTINIRKNPWNLWGMYKEK